jgi:glycosyltransferase involved in cell wall biosynthesis
MGDKVFSVVVLCFRHFEHLNNAISSVLSQDYKRIELIVSDDGSDNFPTEEIHRFIEKNKTPNICSVTVRQESENVGTVKHLNHARHCCHGDYIVFLAADDMFYNERVLSSYVQGLEDAPSNCYIEMAQTAMYDEHMGVLTEYYLKKPVQDAIEATVKDSTELMRMLLRYGPCLPSTSTCFTADFFTRFGDFDEHYQLVEDFPMHFRLAKENWVIHYANFVAIKHRHGGISHGQKGARTTTVLRYYTDLYQSMVKLILPAINIYLPENEAKHVRRNWKKQQLWIEINSFKKQNATWKLIIDGARKVKRGAVYFPLKKWTWFLRAYLITMVSKCWISKMIAAEFGVQLLPWIDTLAWVLLGATVLCAVAQLMLKVYRKAAGFDGSIITLG